MSKRYRGWTLTLNNYSEEEYSNLIKVAQQHTEKYVFGKEVGKCGTHHIQGYINFKNGKTFESVIRILNNPRFHIEGAKGSPKQNWNYCTKDGEYVSKGFNEERVVDEIPRPEMKAGKVITRPGPYCTNSTLYLEDEINIVYSNISGMPHRYI